MAISGGDGSIILTTKVDQSGLNKGIQTMKSGIDSISLSVTKLGAALGASFGIYQLVNFSKQSIQLASDLQEVQNVVDVAFGDMSHKMENFANTALETFGMSRLQAKQTGSTFMSMANGIGIATEKASDMSIQLTALTGDMASFYNVSHEEAQTALSSIFTGETETLKRYGVLLTEVNLEQFAMANGIEKSVSAMTAQEKTMLRYYYVLNATSRAQGDYARTSDSFANKTRKLAGMWEEMQVIFGETLIVLADAMMPVIQTVIKGLTIAMLYLSAFVKGMQGIAPETSKAKKSVETAGAEIGKMGAQIADSTLKAKTNTNAIKAETSAIKNLGSATKETVKQLAQFDDLMVLQTAGSNKIDIGFNTPDFDSVLSDLEIEFPKIELPDYSEQFSSLEEFIGSETWNNIEEFQKWVNDNKDNIELALEIGMFALAAKGVEKLVRWIGSLVGAFKKKDASLDTQKGKLQTETELVYGLVPAFEFATGSAYDFGYACDHFPEILARRDGQLVTAAERLNEFGTEAVFAKDSAYELVPAIDAVTVASDNLVPYLDSATDMLVDTGLVAEGTGLKLGNLKNDIDNLVPAFKTALESGETFAIDLESNISTLFDNLNEKISTFQTDTLVKAAEFETDIKSSASNAAIKVTSVVADLCTNVYENAKKLGEETSLIVVKSLDNILSNTNTFLEVSSTNTSNWMETVATGIAAVGAAVEAVVPGTAEVNTPELSFSTVALLATVVAAQDTKKRNDAFRSGIKSADWQGALAFGSILFSGVLGIPAFAQGTVVPPNREFLAVLGDNTREHEIVSPVSTMKQAFMEAMTEMGGNFGGNGNTTVVLEIDGREFGHAVLEQGQRESRRLGTRMVLA